MAYETNMERVEARILRSVKFIDFMLQEVRKENSDLQQSLGTSYPKYIGISSPFEEAIHSLRKVKGEFDSYLKIVRNDLISKYKKQNFSRR